MLKLETELMSATLNIFGEQDEWKRFSKVNTTEQISYTFITMDGADVMMSTCQQIQKE